MVRESAPHFLVVDDDEVDRMALMRRLRAMEPGATVSEASSPADGLDTLKAGAVDCVLVDYNMPLCDGVSMISLIRQMPQGETLPIIMVTGSDEVSVAVQAIQSGADEYLNKAAVTDTTLGWAIHSARNRAELRRDAQSRDTAMRNFAFHAAHDLKSPLNGIVGLAAVLKYRADELPEDAVGFLSQIEEQGRYMASLIDDLLAYAESGNLDDQTGPVSLDAVIARACRVLEQDVRASGARIDSQAGLEVTGDQAQLERVFINLIQNAIKYRNEAAPEIRLTAHAQGEHVRIDVADNGLGIAPELADRVFDPLERGTATDQTGHGLGLAIVKRIVEAHGGKVWCQPGETGGTVFSLTLQRHGVE